MYGTPPTCFVLQWPPSGSCLTKKRVVAYYIADVQIFMVTQCVNDIKHFYCPTNEHNFKKRRVIKIFLNKGGCSNMFRFTRKPSSGSHSQYLAKITHSVQCENMEVVQTLSVLWLHSMTCETCVVCTGSHGVGQ